MRQTDILIAGGGLAGSTAAAMLGRTGHATVLVDPHAIYPPDFRAEKLDSTQIAVLRKTGVGDAVLRAATLDGESWIARFGRLLEKRPGDQHGILYDAMVNAMRGEIPPGVDIIHAKVMDVATSADRQTVTLSTGEQISARLVVVANGLNVGLRHKLGMERRDISKTHSIMLGFDLVPGGAELFVSGAHLLRRASVGPHRLHHAVSDWRDDAREPLRLSRAGRPVAEAVPRCSARDAAGADAGSREDHRRLRCAGTRAHPAGRSLCDGGRREAGRRAHRRCVLDLMPDGRHRHRQGVHRRRAARATSTSRAGSRRPGWARTRSRRSTPTRCARPITRSRRTRRS